MQCPKKSKKYIILSTLPSPLGTSLTPLTLLKKQHIPQKHNLVMIYHLVGGFNPFEKY